MRREIRARRRCGKRALEKEGKPAGADHEISAGVGVAGFQIDDAWTLHDGFTVS